MRKRGDCCCEVLIQDSVWLWSANINIVSCDQSPERTCILAAAIYIYADLRLPNIIVCSSEHHLGVRIPDAANVARMASVD